jgi:excisionase family DNA binding protein
MSKEEEVLSAKEVGTLLRVSENTVFKWVGKGWLTPMRFGRTLRFRRSDLMAAMERRLECEPPPKPHRPELS